MITSSARTRKCSTPKTSLKVFVDALVAGDKSLVKLEACTELTECVGKLSSGVDG